MLRHMYEAGAWVLQESAIADLPADLRWLFESGAVTIEQLAAIHATIGATTAADLAAAVEREAIRAVPGVGAEVEYNVAAALFDLRATLPRVPLGRATAMIEPVLDELRGAPSVQWALPTGSLRRGEETVGDVEVVAAADDPSAAIESVRALPGIARILHRSDRRIYVLLDRVQLGLRVVPPMEAGAALLHLTGSARHLSALREAARERGGRLTFAGYMPPGGGRVVAHEEEDIYAALGLPFIPPEIRQGADEIVTARNGLLPLLVTRVDVRGDLHMHTTWSDGRDSVEAMVARCRDLGYEYCAITDHSPRSAAARTISGEDLKRQADEVARAREQFPGVHVLHGCEVDILPDGRLDLPDRILERLDIVLASLHDSAGHAPEQLLERYSTAMRHPLVNIVTHPTNRLVPNRPGYDLDYDQLFGTAVETGTLVEIDGAPAHLDLDGALARRAIAAGATVVIDSDAHRTDLLDRQMQLGILTARRGWVEPRHVANTRSIEQVRALVARKRRR